MTHMRRPVLIGLTVLALAGALALAINSPANAHASVVFVIFVAWLWRR